ncbi:MAG: sulfatase-like hydrolase/transferase [Candidatus Latescibacterota bacterium]|nr:MAG: sulfatase-like hydrolase/transferase [Candidatus Latescibacterota bacterium]
MNNMETTRKNETPRIYFIRFLTIGLILGLVWFMSMVKDGDTLSVALRNAVAYWLATVAIAAVSSLLPIVVLHPIQRRSNSPLFAAFVAAVPVAVLLIPDAIIQFSGAPFLDSFSPRNIQLSYICFGLALFFVLTWLFRWPFLQKATDFGRYFRGRLSGVVFGVYVLGILYLALTLIAPSVKGEYSGQKSTERPNIVLIVVDALRTRSLGCYGANVAASPTLDQLAANGLCVEGAFTSAPASVPGHASILLGRSIEEHRAFHNSQGIDTVFASVASELGMCGYRCFGISMNALISADAGFAQGFDFYWSWSKRKRIPPGAPIDFVLRQVAAVQIARGVFRINSTNWNSSVFLRKRYEPFFCFLQYMPVHKPYTDNRRTCWANRDRQEELQDLYERGQLVNLTSKSARQVARSHAKYLGAIDYVNWLIAQVTRTLEKRGLMDNTVLIITSDHGENMAEHGDKCAFSHEGYFNSSLEIPLIVSSPRLGFRGEVLKTLTGADRIASLVRDLASDDSHLLAGRLYSVREMLEKSEHLVFVQPCFFVLYDDSMKVVADYDQLDNPPHLYRWREDPLDRNDLSGNLVQHANKGCQRIEEILRANGLLDACEVMPPVDEERMRHLRALGYID